MPSYTNKAINTNEMQKWRNAINPDSISQVTNLINQKANQSDLNTTNDNVNVLTSNLADVMPYKLDWVNLTQSSYWTNRTDDATGINNLLSSNVLGSDTIYVPDGNYTINSPILVPSNRRLIFGKNANIYRNFSTGSTGNATIRNSDQTNGNQNIEIMGGNFYANANMTGKHFGFDTVTNLKLYNNQILSVVNDWNTSFKRVTDMSIIGMYINSGSSVGNDGIHISSGSNINISDCIIYCGDDCIALSVENNTETSITNVNINNCYCSSTSASAIRLLVSATPNQIQHVNITNVNGKSMVSTPTLKIEDQTSTGLISDVTFENIKMDCSTNTDKGFNLLYANKVTLKNVVLNSPYNQGFYASHCNDLVLDTCKVLGTRNAGTQGIYVIDSVNVTVDKCLVDGAQSIGIYFSMSSTGVSNGRITNNTSRNNKSNGISLNTATHCIITGNTIANNTGWGINETSTASNYNIVDHNNLITNTNGISTNGANSIKGTNNIVA